MDLPTHINHRTLHETKPLTRYGISRCCVCTTGGLTRRGVTSSLTSSGLTTAVTCSVPSCDEPVCVDSELYCIQHHSTTQRVSKPLARLSLLHDT